MLVIMCMYGQNHAEFEPEIDDGDFHDVNSEDFVDIIDVENLMNSELNPMNSVDIKDSEDDSENDFPELTAFLDEENARDEQNEVIGQIQSLGMQMSIVMMMMCMMNAVIEIPVHDVGGKFDVAIDSLPAASSATGTSSSKPRWKRLRRGITVDSGAANNVMPRRMVRHKGKIRPSAASKAGVCYVAANNGRIPNEGEVDFEFTTEAGHCEMMVVQIAEVNKALGSVSYMVDAGFKFIFDKDELTGKDLSVMVHKATGRTTRFRRDRNVWVLDAYVKDGNVVSNEAEEAPFGRQP